MDINHTIKLSNGIEIPQLGFGCYKVSNEQIEQAVTDALEANYRSIDTASFYANERGVGNAIKNSGIKREDIFLTTKIWCTDQGYKQTFRAFEQSLNELQTDYIDLYLIHWPMPQLFLETWKAMEELYQKGKIRAIGLSNCHKYHIEELLKIAKIKPTINQIELHPHLTQEDLVAYCKEKEIAIEAWSPLKRGDIFGDTIISELSKKHKKSPAQIILRWHLQKGYIVIPKSIHKQRIIENKEIFDFELSEEEISMIDAGNRDERSGTSPDSFFESFKKKGIIGNKE